MTTTTSNVQDAEAASARATTIVRVHISGDRRRNERWLAFTLLALWVSVVATGWWLMTEYSYRSEPAIVTADDWPAQAALTRNAAGPTLLVFLHPRCPCSNATIAEMERLEQRRALLGAKILVVVTMPTDGDGSWLSSPVVQRSRSLHNSEIVIDRGGRLAEQFGASASGTVMLYSAAGRRQYTGGVTASRGHEGQNAGAEAIASLLAGSSANSPAIPAFGCRLVTSAPGLGFD